jgi:alpha-galactosidase
MLKKRLCGSLVLLFCFSAVTALRAEQPAADRASFDKASTFIQTYLAMGKTPPFSFLYGGRPAASFLTKWNVTEEPPIVTDEKVIRTTAFADPSTGLIVRSVCTVYKDYPAVEWVLNFKNTSRANTPFIDEIQAVDAELPFAGKGDAVLHRAAGSDDKPTDFMPIDEPLLPGREISFGVQEGRSSGRGALPFFNVELPGGGVVAGLGWTGLWQASVARNAAGTARLKAGMKRTHFVLLPGEEVRSPSIALIFWAGEDRFAGHNAFRRFVLKHHTPQKDGRPVVMPLASSAGNGGPAPCNENSCTSERWSVATAYRYAQFGLAPEVWWIDAGWFDGSQASWWEGVGNWTVNRANFPNGLRPVSDAARQLGMGFCVWFEPERVFKGTRLDREHPEWLIRKPGADSALLNLGLPAARKWMTDYISDTIEREGITVYRQDFNFDPQEYWRGADSPDRIGISEIKHIEGLYAFWDELLKRHPGLLIDNCSGGGRRLDLETISRSVPLWRSDYPFTEFTQSQTYGIHLFLPCNGTGNITPETYNFRSTISSALIVNWNLSGAFPVRRAQNLLAEYKRLRPYFYGDFYPLTGYSDRDSDWLAYQFDRPETQDGMALAFRRSQCETPTCAVKLRGLNPDLSYEIFFEDYGIKIVKTGASLLKEGLELKIPEAAGSLLITYRAAGR